MEVLFLNIVGRILNHLKVERVFSLKALNSFGKEIDLWDYIEVSENQTLELSNAPMPPKLYKYAIFNLCTRKKASYARRKPNFYFLCPNLGSLNGNIRQTTMTERTADIMKVARKDAA